MAALCFLLRLLCALTVTFFTYLHTLRTGTIINLNDHFVIAAMYIKPLRAAPHFVLSHHYKYSHSRIVLCTLLHAHTC